jgi:hypothetical protein
MHTPKGPWAACLAMALAPLTASRHLSGRMQGSSLPCCGCAPQILPVVGSELQGSSGHRWAMAGRDREEPHASRWEGAVKGEHIAPLTAVGGAGRAAAGRRGGARATPPAVVGGELFAPTIVEAAEEHA